MYYLSYETQKDKDRLDVRVDFNDGKSYLVIFCSADYVKKQLKRSQCMPIPGLIPITEVSMRKVKEVINEIVMSGFFDHFVPISEGQ